MNPDGGSAEDRIVTLISNWLARHLSNDALRLGLDEIGTAQLAPDQAEAVEELLAALESEEAGGRGQIERVARETLEAVALG